MYHVDPARILSLSHIVGLDAHSTTVQNVTPEAGIGRRAIPLHIGYEPKIVQGGMIETYDVPITKATTTAIPTM